MTLIYLKDIIPILISYMMFSLLAMAHRVLLPNKYSAFLQFKEDEDVNRTIQSTSIRIIYLIAGTCFLNLVLGFNEKQIGIGIFIACFLNVWPAIIQNQLLKLRKNRTEYLILLGYLVFIGASVFVGVMTVRLFIPLLQGDTTVYWLDNQAISILSSLILMVVPVSAEVIIAKFARIVVTQTIDTFIEEVYILEKQLNMECSQVENNRYLIDRVARENDINVALLETILRLEIFYRGRMYNKLLENCACKYFSTLAIKKNISVGVAQIKISTAARLLKENPHSFIKRLCNDDFNIELCAKLLKDIMDQYEDMLERGSYDCEDYEDVFDYIACEYMGAYAEHKDKTALIYSAVLRSFMKEEPLYYTGSEQMERCLVCIYQDGACGVDYDRFQAFVEQLGENVIIRKQVFIEEQRLEFEFICDNEYYVGLANDFAKENGCEIGMD